MYPDGVTSPDYTHQQTAVTNKQRLSLDGMFTLNIDLCAYGIARTWIMASYRTEQVDDGLPNKWPQRRTRRFSSSGHGLLASICDYTVGCRTTSFPRFVQYPAFIAFTHISPRCQIYHQLKSLGKLTVVIQHKITSD